MLNNEILKRLASDTLEAVDAIEAKARESRLIAQRTKEFIANGGQIQQIKQGATSEFPDGSLPIRTQKDYKLAHDKMAKSRNNGSKNGGRGIELAKKAIGPECLTCGGNVIYVSSNQCVACQRARNKRTKSTV